MTHRPYPDSATSLTSGIVSKSHWLGDILVLFLVRVFCFTRTAFPPIWNLFSKSVFMLQWDGLVGMISSLVIYLLWLTLSTVTSFSEYMSLWMRKYECDRLRSRRDCLSHCFQSPATCIIVSSLLEICQCSFIKLVGTLGRRTTSSDKLLNFQPKRLVAGVFPVWICLNLVLYLRYPLPALISQSVVDCAYSQPSFCQIIKPSSSIVWVLCSAGQQHC